MDPSEKTGVPVEVTGATAVHRQRSLWRGPAWFAGLMLLIPLWGNHYVPGWNWHPGGFVAVGILFFGLGVAYRLLTRNREARAYRVAVVLTLATSFAEFWGTLVQRADVTPEAWRYFPVLGVGLVGVVLTRGRPAGLSRTLAAMGLAQCLAVVLVTQQLFLRTPEFEAWTPPEIRGVVGNSVHVLLFFAAAWLFHQAARQVGGLPVVSPAGGVP